MTGEFRMVPAGNKALWFLGVISLIFVGMIALFGFTAYSCRHVEYHVSREGLRIQGVYGRMVPAASLVTAEARWVDLQREPGLQPVTRTNGVGLPGFLAGWVRLKDGSKGLVFLTDASRVVGVPTRDGFTLLVSVTDPDGLVAALRQPQGTKTSSEVFHMVPASGAAVWFCVGMSLLMGLMLALMAYLAWLARHVRYRVGSFGLRIIGMYGRTIPATSLMVEQARQVHLHTERKLRPILRTNGAGLPGFLAGWMRLENHDKALVFLTDADRVVLVPTWDGYTLLLSVTDPPAFLDALRRHAA